jgi:hypothetical protein
VPEEEEAEEESDEDSGTERIGGSTERGGRKKEEAAKSGPWNRIARQQRSRRGGYRLPFCCFKQQQKERKDKQ